MFNFLKSHSPFVIKFVLFISVCFIIFKCYSLYADHTLNKKSTWSLFNFIFSDQVLEKLKRYLLKYVQFNRQKFRGVSEQLSFTPQLFLVICFVLILV